MTEHLQQYRFRNYIQSLDVLVWGYWKPKNVQEIVDLVREAERMKLNVHAVGAAYSFEDLWTTKGSRTIPTGHGGPVRTLDWIVDLGYLNHVLPAVTDARAAGCPLTPAWKKRQLGEGVDRLVHVQAGARLYDLNRKLDEMGLSLLTMGGAQGQHLAGACSTSTHGSDYELPPMCDFVLAVHLVTKGGREVWIESKSHPVTADDAALEKAVGRNLDIIRDDELLHAVQVSMGRFGIIYSVVYQVRTEIRLAEYTQELPWKKVAAALAAGVGRYDGTPFGTIQSLLHDPPHDLCVSGPYRYFDLVLNPRKRESCWLRRRWISTRKTDLNVAPSSNFLCCTGVANVVLHMVANALRAHAGWVGAIPVYGAFKSPEILAHAAELDVKATHPHVTGGEALAMSLNAIWSSQVEHELGWLIDEVTQAAVGGEMKASMDKGRCGPNWVISAGAQDPKTLGDCYRGTSIELVFGLGDRKYIDFIDKVLDEAGKHLHAGYLAVRFTRRSDALLSMHSLHEVNCSIEITSLRGVKGNKEWLDWVEATALHMGARPHWGQENSIDAARVRSLYHGKIERWRAQCSRIVGTSNTFSSDYTRLRGLEP
jgi:hypothetical protein